jgi:hypothetical protein
MVMMKRSRFGLLKRCSFLLENLHPVCLAVKNHEDYLDRCRNNNNDPESPSPAFGLRDESASYRAQYRGGKGYDSHYPQGSASSFFGEHVTHNDRIQYSTSYREADAEPHANEH